MGAMQIYSMLGEYYAWLENGELNEPPMTLEDIMEWHLTSNHYPRVDRVFVKPCIDAITLIFEGNDPETTLIELPNETLYDVFPAPVTARTLCDAFNLEAFLEFHHDWHNVPNARTSVRHQDPHESHGMTQVPQCTSRHLINLIDGRIMTITLTDEGIVFDVYERGDNDPFTRAMTYDEWANWVEDTDPKNGGELPMKDTEV